MTKLEFVTLALAIVLSGCGRIPDTGTKKEVAEYEVYSALLDTLYVHPRTQADSILFPVIRESTLVAHTIEGARGGFVQPQHLRAFDSLGQEMRIDPLIYRRDLGRGSDLGSVELDTLIQRFNVNNDLRLRLDSSLFSGHIRSTLISAVEEKETFSGNGSHRAEGQAREPEGPWSQFYQRYPRSHGIIALSRVAFNDSSTQAVVYWEHLEGKLAGSGEFVILALRPNHRWIVVFRHELWVS